jgi:hypothetical protein
MEFSDVNQLFGYYRNKKENESRLLIEGVCLCARE